MKKSFMCGSDGEINASTILMTNFLLLLFQFVESSQKVVGEAEGGWSFNIKCRVMVTQTLLRERARNKIELLNIFLHRVTFKLARIQSGVLSTRSCHFF